MNWYKKAKLNKTASLTLYVSGYRRENAFDNVFNLSSKLRELLFVKWLDKQDLAYFSEYHKVAGLETIIMDGATDMDSLTGIINFYIEGIPPNKLNGVLEEINRFLSENNIETDEFKKEQSRMYDVPVIRIPILSNPKGQSVETEDRPPEINMANSNAFFIFKTILKYDKDLWEDGSFDPIELKRRIEYFEGEDKLEEGSHAGQGAIVISPDSLNDALSDADMLSGRSALSSYDEYQVRDRLNQIKNVCEWAINHGYKELYVA